MVKIKGCHRLTDAPELSDDVLEEYLGCGKKETEKNTLSDSSFSIVDRLKSVLKLLRSSEYFLMTSKELPYRIEYEYDTDTDREIFYIFLKKKIDERNA